jgi:hypothetical protein
VSELPALATVAQLETRLGVPTGTLAGTDLARAQADLADASDLVRTEGRRPWTDSTAPPSIVVVTLQVAMRAYNNPNGYAGETVSANGATYSYSSDQQALGIYLTTDEQAVVLLAARQSTYSGAWRGTGSVLTPKPDVRGLPATGYGHWSWCP